MGQQHQPLAKGKRATSLMPRRSTTEPAFLLHLLQSAAQNPHGPLARYAALMDVKMAYDTMDYSIILIHLKDPPHFP